MTINRSELVNTLRTLATQIDPSITFSGTIYASPTRVHILSEAGLGNRELAELDSNHQLGLLWAISHLPYCEADSPFVEFSISTDFFAFAVLHFLETMDAYNAIKFVGPNGTVEIGDGDGGFYWNLDELDPKLVLPSSTRVITLGEML